MADHNRLSHLLGNQLPVRVIPARPPAEPAEPWEEPGEHKAFRDLVVDKKHPAWIDGVHIPDVHNETLHHEHDGGGSQHVVVSSANRNALEAHLDSVKIWTKVKPSAPTDGPEPVYVDDVVSEAVQSATGSSVTDHLARPRDEQHVNYLDLLGADVASAVRSCAVDVLAGRLQDLASAGIIDDGDPDTIDCGCVIDQFLGSKADQPKDGPGLEEHEGHAAWLQEHPGSVLTRFGPIADGHDLAFSIRDIGTLLSGQRKVYWLGQGKQRTGNKDVSGKNVHEKVKVTAGNVGAWLYDNNVEKWSDPSIKKGTSDESNYYYLAGTWKLSLYGNANSDVELSGTFKKSELSLT